MKYQVWFVPTRLTERWDWEPRLILATNDLADAYATAYIERCDEPSPDKDDYMVWHVEEITHRN